MIFSLKLFRYIFFFRQLFYQPGKHFLCLFVNISKVTVQLAGSQQIRIKSPFMLLNMPQVPLSPHTYWFLFFFGQ